MDQSMNIMLDYFVFVNMFFLAKKREHQPQLTAPCMLNDLLQPRSLVQAVRPQPE
jgi:hypothetical protein